MKKFLLCLTLAAAMALRRDQLARAATATNAPAAAGTRPWNSASPRWKPTSTTATRAAGGSKDKDGNLLRTDLTTPTVGTPGPGHNAWMMTSAALVLFMTLPGLALFYGGLVRRKNVLSVLAQCFVMRGPGHDPLVGCAATASSSQQRQQPFLGGLEVRLPQRRRPPRPTPTTPPGFRRTCSRCIS